MNILIVAPAWVGDMVMAQSLFKLLKQNHPNMQIDLVAPSATASLAQRMPEIRHTYELKAGHGGLQLKQRWALGKLLRKNQYDQAIVLPNSWKSALIPFFAKIKKRTGWRGECRYGLINDLRILDKQKYPLMIQRFCALGIDSKANLPADLPWPHLQIDSANQQQCLSKFNLTPPQKTETITAEDQPLEHFQAVGQVLALCPGAEFGISKRWPAEYFAAVAEDFLRKGGQVWILGGPKDKSIAEDIQTRCNQACTDLVGVTKLPDAIDLLALASLVVSNDSGLMHISAAVQRRLIVIYGSTSPGFTPPLSNQVTILSKKLPCSPCFKRTCQYGHYHCLTEILPQQVIDAE